MPPYVDIQPHVRNAPAQLAGQERRSWEVARALASEALLLVAAVAVYFGVRHLTVGDRLTAEANAAAIVDLERSLGLFVERDLQQWALGVDGLVPVMNQIYVYGHWPVIVAVMVCLAWRRPSAYVVYRNALLISGVVGMVIVALHPVSPPRLMDLGFVDTVVQHTDAYRVLQPPAFTNPYAAMPSFHVGWDLLVGIALVRESGHAWVRAAGRALPALMVASVVITGNHYVLDAVAGDAIVLGSLAVSLWWSRRAQKGLPIPAATP
ncbi:MAG: phosphatase PAP2 family protein [Streptomyces albidoflavus]